MRPAPTRSFSETRSSFHRQALPQTVGSWVYATMRQEGDTDIRLLQLDAEQRPVDLVSTPRSEYQAQLSPDGRWLAYASAGGPAVRGLEIYVQPNPPTGARWQVSLSRGYEPRWRADGKEIFYLAPDGVLMAVDVETTTSDFRAGSPRLLFQTHVATTELGVIRNHYAVAANGERFLFTVPVTDSGPAAVTVVLNWTAEQTR
jgi:eukaryotic-like serine/threonine-protein kinase